MAINFIFPDRLMDILEKGIRAAGDASMDFDLLKADILEIANCTEDRSYVEKHLGGIIPKDLAVFVMNEEKGDALMAKYKFGLSSQKKVRTEAMIAFGMDTRHDAVLMLPNDTLKKEYIIRHELVHYDQIKRGDLHYRSDGCIEWRKPGEEVVINCAENKAIGKKIALISSEEYFFHEFQKPWEVEAYALTTPKDQIERMSKRCRGILEKYLSKNEVHA